MIKIEGRRSRREKQIKEEGREKKRERREK